MRINVLTTGDEVMAGDIVDSNSSYIAQKLKTLGLTLHQKITVGDDMDLLCEAMEQLSQSGDVLIVNGGLGPTVDDLTAEALAKTCGVAVEEHAMARAILQALADRRGLPLNASNLKQAMLPQGCEIIPNPVGTASGFSMEHNGCYIACTPGVPRELFAMMEQQILPLLESRFTIDTKVHTHRLRSFGIGESTVQQVLNQELGELPPGVDLGFRASKDAVEIKLTSSGEEARHFSDILALQLQEKILPEHIFGQNDQTLAEVLVALLQRHNLTVTAAESCTGGRIASAITSIAGSSHIFEAGFVSYSNRIKQQLLNVSTSSLEQHGAVSEAVVQEMLAGALANSGADLGVAVSGIAGPDGGTEEKPVGTVWIAWGFKDNIKAQKYYWPRSRQSFQEMVTFIALDLLRREILGFDTSRCHFAEFKLFQPKH